MNPDRARLCRSLVNKTCTVLDTPEQMPVPNTSRALNSRCEVIGHHEVLVEYDHERDVFNPKWRPVEACRVQEVRLFELMAEAQREIESIEKSQSRIDEIKKELEKF